MANDIQLHYFGGRGIGEPIRLLLTVGGIEFADHRYTFDEFAAMDEFKTRLPFGQLPALEVDGSLYGQTDSLMRYAARLSDLYPTMLTEAVRSDMIVAHQADIHSAIAKMSFDGVPGAPGTKLVPEEERLRRLKAWFDVKLPGMLQCLEDLVENGFMVGGSLTWADICVFNRLTQLLDIESKLLNNRFTNLRAVYQNVAKLPAIKGWIESHAEDYPRGNSLEPG